MSPFVNASAHFCEAGGTTVWGCAHESRQSGKGCSRYLSGFHMSEDHYVCKVNPCPEAPSLD